MTIRALTVSRLQSLISNRNFEILNSAAANQKFAARWVLARIPLK